MMDDGIKTVVMKNKLQQKKRISRREWEEGETPSVEKPPAESVRSGSDLQQVTVEDKVRKRPAGVWRSSSIIQG